MARKKSSPGMDPFQKVMISLGVLIVGGSVAMVVAEKAAKAAPAPAARPTRAVVQREDGSMAVVETEGKPESSDGVYAVGGGMTGAAVGFAVGGPVGALVGGTVGVLSGFVMGAGEADADPDEINEEIQFRNSSPTDDNEDAIAQLREDLAARKHDVAMSNLQRKEAGQTQKQARAVLSEARHDEAAARHGTRGARKAVNATEAELKRAKLAMMREQGLEPERRGLGSFRKSGGAADGRLVLGFAN